MVQLHYLYHFNDPTLATIFKVMSYKNEKGGILIAIKVLLGVGGFQKILHN